MKALWPLPWRKRPQPTREEMAALYRATIARYEHEQAVLARRQAVR